MNIVDIKEIMIDALIDNIKILPFLFVTFVLMEYLEEKLHNKAQSSLISVKKTGPLWGSILGIIPQCGFSAAASNLYAGRVISVGTLISIYLSTSDEMLPIMISEAVNPLLIVKILLSKVAIGLSAGFLIDFIYIKIMKKDVKQVDIHHFCEHEKCQCGQGILKPALKHTVKIFVFLLVVSLALGVVIELFGFESISGLVFSNIFIGPLLAGVIGLIPNCAASVVITKLFLEGAISFGTLLSGLLVGAGVGLLVLLKVNEDKKENACIIAILYLVGVVAGIVINFIG